MMDDITINGNNIKRQSVLIFGNLYMIQDLNTSQAMNPIALNLTSHANDRSVIKQIWWRQEMESLSALLAIYEENQSAANGFPPQRASNCELCILFFCYSEEKENLFNKLLTCRWHERK